MRGARASQARRYERTPPAPQLDGHPYRVSCGWPATAALSHGKRRTGECWFPVHSSDHKTHNVFISPVLQNPIEVLETLARELIHVAAGPNVGHKGNS